MSSKKAFLIISFFIFVTDFCFVVFNYFSANQNLEMEIKRQKEESIAAFNQYLNANYTSMLQLASFVAHDDVVKESFSQGRTAFLENRHDDAKEYRDNLYNYLSDSWSALQGKYSIRQLHFHIGPGDFSFLRVHKPEKFGDDLSKIRHTIVDAINNNKETYGFESGRVYSGLRGVTPLKNSEGQVIGALEAGTSFKQLVTDISKSISAHFAILLDVPHMEATMWKERLQPFFDKEPPIHGHFIEATSDGFIRNLLSMGELKFIKGQTSEQIIKVGQKHFVIFSHPLHSYKTTRDNNPNGVGFVVAWKDISNLMEAHYNTLIFNVIYALLAFLFIEMIIYKGVNVATRKLQELIDEQKEDLKQKNSRLEEFARTLSHDLKNSLNSIVGLADHSINTLDTTPDSPEKYEVRSYLDIMLGAGQEMTDLINNLLKYGSEGLQKKELVSMGDIVKQVSKILKVNIDEANAQISQEDTVQTVLVDRAMFTQVMINLVSNSLKYKSSLPPKISISVKKGNESTRIYVEDNGIGIEPEYLDKVFEKRVRVEGVADKVEGHGIGLHTVRTIVKDHKGTITVKSNLGEGTTFIITLPNEE